LGNQPTDVHDVNVLATQYNETLIRLVDQQSPVKVITYCVRPSNEWFDEEYRKMKAHVRRLERCYKLTNNTADRRIWTAELRAQYKLFKRKRTVDSIAKNKCEKDIPKHLLRTLNATMGLTVVVQELTHTVNQFSDFFVKKVRYSSMHM